MFEFRIYLGSGLLGTGLYTISSFGSLQGFMIVPSSVPMDNISLLTHGISKMVLNLDLLSDN